MIKIIAEFFIKEEALAEAIKSAEVAVAKTRQEAGNISYEVFQASQDSTHLVFIEEWKSQEAIDFHMNTAHFKQLIEEVTKLQVKEPAINVYSKII